MSCPRPHWPLLWWELNPGLPHQGHVSFPLRHSHETTRRHFKNLAGSRSRCNEILWTGIWPGTTKWHWPRCGSIYPSLGATFLEGPILKTLKTLQSRRHFKDASSKNWLNLPHSPLNQNWGSHLRMAAFKVKSFFYFNQELSNVFLSRQHILSSMNKIELYIICILIWFKQLFYVSNWKHRKT